VRPRIGLYVHDRGHTSRSRAAALLAVLDADATLLTALRPEELPGGHRAPLVPLRASVEATRPPGGADLAAEGGADHAPEHEVTRAHVETVLRWRAQERPDLLVVDGAPRLAALAHLAGVPTVAVQALGSPPLDVGEGTPPRTVAPYPEELEPAGVSAAVRKRTTYVGGYSRLDGRCLSRDDARTGLDLDPEQPVVAVVTGAGMGRPSERRLLEAAGATRRWRWLIAGAFTSTEGVVPDNIRRLGWRDDLHGPLAAADVVVSGGGDATTADVASVRRPHLVMQDAGATHERRGAVAQLVRGRVATVLPVWPAAECWPALLRDVMRMDTSAQVRFCDHGGGRRLAVTLDAWARERRAATALAA
jgi:UDP-N-acetylglucosamine--N-acetylmuramyl-(pentapeptide) pyrophosphoryl-undecaprenol N-acetylglucosamine transferase